MARHVNASETQVNQCFFVIIWLRCVVDVYVHTIKLFKDALTLGPCNYFLKILKLQAYSEPESDNYA